MCFANANLVFHFFIYGVKMYIFAKKVTAPTAKGLYNTIKKILR